MSSRHEFSLETVGGDPTQAFDGAVLEISLGGGPFLDILDAGGAFVTNGYNTTIAGSGIGNNPLPNRPAWSGDSGGFITTIITLPAAAAGQTVQFKWRCATDDGNANGSIGWWLDNIAVNDGFNSSAAAVPPPSS